MFDRIGQIFNELLARREREANIRSFESLSDRVLWDIGVDRSEIPGLFGSAAAGRTIVRKRRRLDIVGEAHCSPRG
ncbi:hypothetical protein [Labrys monachus]|uniref:Uncharacterized protein YjiS (DUF1127 family) n=1 Tax=Labrys monachus TaxID=217067 RepID=A0ABU0FHN0_9HYPH|nr:hypothetical protein [Labrys monachus]MDQ0394085.1 uncharacterized protein YjiS (DUF1127 family) [Labrys monachus]